MPWVLKTGENCLILTRIEYSRVFFNEGVESQMHDWYEDDVVFQWFFFDEWNILVREILQPLAKFDLHCLVIK